MLVLEDWVNVVSEAEDLPGQIAASSEEFFDGAGSVVYFSRLAILTLSSETFNGEFGVEWRQWHGKFAERTLAAAHVG
jgi:hypothetical protein